MSNRVADFTRDADRRRNLWHALDAGSQNARGPGEAVVSFLVGKAFTPEMVEELSQTFERVCSAMMILPGDPKAEQIARKIIELAERGLRDKTRMLWAAIKELVDRL